MNSVTDITSAIALMAAKFFEDTGITPAVCCVSRELYRLLVEQNAAAKGMGNLIIATHAVTRILSGASGISIVIDETLSGRDICFG